LADSFILLRLKANILIIQHMDNEEEAYEAVKSLDGAFFAGATIKVEVRCMY